MRLTIDAPDDVKRIFYTGFFHALLYPRQIDEDGRYYSAFDDEVHSGTMYSCLSFMIRMSPLLNSCASWMPIGIAWVMRTFVFTPVL